MKPKLSLEETMHNLKDDVRRLTARLEDSEYRHSLVCEALENLLEGNGYGNQTYELRKAARKALNGVVDVE